MSLAKKLRYGFMKDAGAPALMQLADMKKRGRRQKAPPGFGPPLKSAARLKEIMTRHYLLARYAAGAKPVAWVTSGAPVELLRPLDCYTIYPENHGALCGAKKIGPELCAVAEERGYHQDLCSYARIDLGHLFTGRTPVGRLPKPDLLFASNNICQTVVYWYKVLAHHLKVPLILFDTPYNFGDITEEDIRYMKRQVEEIIPELEKATGRRFSYPKFQEVMGLARDASLAWGEVLGTMKARPAPMTIFDAFVHLAPIVSLRGLPVALEYYRTLLAELRERVERGVGALKDERKRLMWDNIAIWYKVRDFSLLFAEHGMNFVTATYTNAWAETIPHLDTARPVESLAKVYSLVILNNNLNHRLNLMERLIREYQVDGLVIHSARSCKPYSVGPVRPQAPPAGARGRALGGHRGRHHRLAGLFRGADPHPAGGLFRSPRKSGGTVIFRAGIDVGSLSTNAVILDPRDEVAGYSIVLTGANSTEAAEEAFRVALARAGVSRDAVQGIVATGYGRQAVPFADRKKTEISCHGLGAFHLFPAAGTVIDIGGQDSKVIRLGEGGKVLDFTMNDKCAAGTGRFLEVMAAKLQVALEELGPLSLQAGGEVPISSVCTVFAESEVVSLVARNHPREEIIRGLHRAIVNRVWSMVQAVGIHGAVTMTGGVAKNRGVVGLLEEKLGSAILIHSEPQIVGALGAALLARGK